MRSFSSVFLAAFLALNGAAARADDAPAPTVKGLYLLTDFPAVTVRPGTTSSRP
jgi:hypothetical protein